MSIVTDLVVSFKINGKIHDIEISQDEIELYNHLLDDNEYTLEYLNSLITTDVISLDGKLQEIYRVNSNGYLEDKIFPLEYSNITENKDKWRDPETSLLLEKYELYIDQVGLSKPFRNKKNMWEQIANDINDVLQLKKTALQVENRFKTLLRRKEYEVKYRRTNAEDDNFKEKLRCVSLERPSKRKYKKIDSLCDSSLEKTETSLQVTLEKIHKEKESGKERRHREKLMLLRKHEAAKERRHREKLELLKEILQSKVLPIADLHACV